MLPICFKPICLIALLLAAGVLGCTAATEPAAKLVGRPVGIEPTSQKVQAEPAARPTNSSRQYPKLDIYLNKLVASGKVPERRYVKEGYIPDKSVGVSLALSGNTETVAAWLESKGVSRRDAAGKYDGACLLSTLSYCIDPRGDADYIIAYLTLDLLAPLAQQPGVDRVRAIEPYPNLTKSLRELAVKFDGPLEPVWGMTPWAELRPATQHVNICFSEEPNSVIAWLESNGVYADRRPAYSRPPAAILSRLATSVADMPPDSELASLLESTLAERPEPLYDIFTATVPVSLLGDLSMQKGIHRVRINGCEGPEGQINARGHPCYTPEQCSPPFAGIRGLGQSETFLLFSNVANPPGVRVGVNYEGDTGKLAIGSCLDGNSSIFVGHGDSVAISGCSAGKAQVRLYLGDELLESYDIAAISLLN